LPDPGRALRLLRPLADDGVAQLRAQWRDHALTMAGIVWGAAAVVLLLSYGAGFYHLMDLGFKKTGDRYLQARGDYTSVELGGARPGRRIVLERDDLDRVRASVPSARWVAAEYQDDAVSARTPYRTRATVVSAATPELQWIKIHRVALGRFFDEEDERRGRPVAVLGANLPEIFFGDADPIGRTIQLDGHPLEVIGVLRHKGQQFITNYGLHDDMIFIPLARGQRIFGLGDAVGALLLDPYRIDETDQLRVELRAALWPHHHLAPEEDQALRTMSVQHFIAPMTRIGVGLEILLGGIGTVILGMAGVGVANLMLALVNRRRVELAMRRACGARRADLTLQLLVETLVVVLAGGTLGVGTGAALAWLVSLLPLPEMMPAPRIEPSVLVTSFVVLVAVGLLSGVTPARTASRVDPAAALRVP
jgi:ABC-type antimicrobial peptide transport system permease subunit